MFRVSWRPSGGRGEYEYQCDDPSVLHKHLAVEVPLLGITIPTDVQCDFVDGKPRLRRDDPNDRKHLNIPPLIAAIAGLPGPRREDKGATTFPLADKKYVMATILCEVSAKQGNIIVLKPTALKPLHSPDYIDVEERIAAIYTAAPQLPAAHALIEMLGKAKAISALSVLATKVHNALPYVPAGPGSAPGAVTKPETDDFIVDYVGKEGKEKIRTHRTKERDRKIVALAKLAFKNKFGKIFCECCGISFGDTYTPLGEDFIEAHHKVPLQQVKGEQETKIEDFAMLCPNCHRMVHFAESCSLEVVKAALASSGFCVEPKNLAFLTSK